MRTALSNLVIRAVLVVLAVLGGVAHADDPLAKPKTAVARDHLTAGNKLYRLREFDQAVEEYKAGALVEDVPVFHYNLGQCYRQLGRYEDAIWHYERFLERGKPAGEIKDAVESFRTQMKAELEKKAMTQPPIEPAPDPKAPTAVEPAKPRVIRTPAPPWYDDTFGWTLAIGGAAALGVSTWLFLDANSLEDDADAQLDQVKRDDLRDQASSRRTIGLAVGIGGLGLLATGVVKLVLRPEAREQTVIGSLSVRLGEDSFSVTGRF